MMETEEIKASIKEAAKHKTSRPSVQWALAHLDQKAAEIRGMVETGWTPPRHEMQKCQDGSHKKIRMIQKPRWDSEQIIHHMLMRQFAPIVTRRLYRYACGSIPGRGTHYAMRTVKRWRDGYKGNKCYVAELDIRHFYDTVDTEILEGMLGKTIRDRRFLELLTRVIDRAGPGLPKGYYTSPWLAHYLLTPLDYHIVQDLHPDHYLRYMDNMFLFARSKKALHGMVREIGRYLREELHMEIKGDWQVYRFEGYNRKAKKETGRAINCLGFVVHRNRVALRKSILKRIRGKANRMHRRKRCRRIDAAAILSYLGYFRHSDTYKYYLRYIKPKVSIRYCKRRISTLSKRAAKQKQGGTEHDGLVHGQGQPGGTALRAGHHQ